MRRRELGPAGRLRRRVDDADEAIAAPVRRFDEAGGLGVVVQRFAELANGDFEDGIADEGIPPDRGDQVFLGDELSGPPQQVLEDREGLGPELDRTRASPQALVDQVERERRELNTAFRGHEMSGRNPNITAAS